MKTVISTPNAPGAIGPYSQAIKVGELLFLSGQLGIDPKTGEITGDVAAVEAALNDVLSVLCGKMGFSPAPITKT